MSYLLILLVGFQQCSRPSYLFGGWRESLLYNGNLVWVDYLLACETHLETLNRLTSQTGRI